MPLTSDRKTSFFLALLYGGIFAALLHLTVACNRSPLADSTLEMTGSLSMFVEEAGVVTPSPGSGEFLLIVELNPAHEPDAEKMVQIFRSGHSVLLRIREEPNQPAILVSDVTSHGEAIIRCQSLEEANRIMDRLHTRPK